MLYKIGIDTIRVNLDELVEITEVYEKDKYRLNTSSSKVRSSIFPVSKVFLNHEEIDYIPEIEIDLSKDLIIANGHIIVASFIGSYKDKLAFFKDRNDKLPISWIRDKETTIFIDTYHLNERKVVIVEHNYVINLEELK